MILSPFDLALLAPIAALIPPRNQEPAVALPNNFARRLAGNGFYGPFQVRPGDHVIEDRAGHPLTLVVPIVDGSGDRREIAVIACLALNILCGFAAPVVELDTIDLAAIAIRQQAVITQASAAE